MSGPPASGVPVVVSMSRASTSTMVWVSMNWRTASGSVHLCRDGSLGSGHPIEQDLDGRSAGGPAGSADRWRRASSVSRVHHRAISRVVAGDDVGHHERPVGRAQVLDDRRYIDLAHVLDAVPHRLRDRVQPSRSRTERITSPVRWLSSRTKVWPRSLAAASTSALATVSFPTAGYPMRWTIAGGSGTPRQPMTKLTSLSGTAMTLRTVRAVEELGDLGVGAGGGLEGVRRRGRRRPRSWRAPCR